MNSLWKRYGLFGLLTALAVGLGPVDETAGCGEFNGERPPL